MDAPLTHPWPSGEEPRVALCDESARAVVLAQYGLDSLEDDPELAQITAFVAELCEAPICLVSVVEEERQRFLVAEGLDVRETPRSSSFCAHAMMGREPLQIANATQHPDFADNPLVTGPPHVRFYAGAPLISEEGAPVGSLCVIDTEPRPDGLTQLQHHGLLVMAEAVKRRLLSRRIHRRAEADRQSAQLQIEQLANLMPDIAFSAAADGTVDFLNERFHTYTGQQTFELHANVHPDDRERVAADWQSALSTGETMESEFRYRRYDGEYRWMLARALPVRGSDGAVDRWFGTITDVDEGHRLSEAREMLAKELSHRIKNIFAVVSGLVALTTRRQPQYEEFGRELIGKIRALGRAHDFVRPAEDQPAAQLQGLLGELFAPYEDEGDPRVVVTGDDLPVAPRSATPLALVFHELATNSAKYGRLSQGDGAVGVRIENGGDEALIIWREEDVPAPDSDETGFGSQLLKMSVEGQLRGRIERDWDEGGLTVKLAVPTEAISG